MSGLENSHNLEQWFLERPKWLQEAAYRIVSTGSLTEKDYSDLLNMCLDEAANVPVKCKILNKGVFDAQESSVPLRLESISEVKGINALCPSRPLEFGEPQLSIVYGRNGSGKSGYVRLIKHACGSRYSDEILPNIFDTSVQSQSALITFNINGTVKNAQWIGKPIDDLYGVDIYDTYGGLVYVNEESEITFEPWTLRFFTYLTEVCEILKKSINEKKATLPSNKPKLPPELANTVNAGWYLNINPGISNNEVEKITKWDEQDETFFNSIRKRLSETNPLEKARILNRNRKSLDEFITYLDIASKGLSDQMCKEYLKVKEDAKAKRNAADKDAELVFSKAPLQGIGTESWMLLWESAKRYSETKAYPSNAFPNISNGAVCVLCQNELNSQSQERFKAFEKFVKNDLQSQAKIAEQKFREVEASLPNILSGADILLRLDSFNINDENMRLRVGKFNDDLLKCKLALIEANLIAEVPELPDSSIIDQLKKVSEELGKQIDMYNDDAKGRNDLENEYKELTSRKWLNQQKKAINDEIARLVQIQKLNAADELANTLSLTKRKSILTESLITLPYINRFEKELKCLKADKIKVEIKKTRAELGHVFHRIILHGVDKNIRTSDILSEGEFRIVSLAAFFADTEGRGKTTPFIFDDPISSLDQVYEEAAAMRLVELSKVRQVIVFTHRLSLVGLLDKYSKKEEVATTIITLSKSRIGDITDSPINISKTKPIANRYLYERLAKLKNVLPVSQQDYDVLAKALCGDIRILLEQIVELDMLAGIIRRYNPEIQTKGKIERLANIRLEDCKFIDDLMTTYSRYEHSQPDEAPVDLPNPDELENDLKEIIGFIESIQNR